MSAGSPGSSEPLPKKREKGFMMSLKRLLRRQQRAADSAGSLRSPPPAFASKATGSSELLGAVQVDAFDSPHGCKAPPRSSASMPHLFPAPEVSSTNLFPSFGASPLQAGAGRRVVPATSSSTTFLQLPAIESCAPALSSGAMADRVSTALSPQQLSPHATSAATESRFRQLGVGTPQHHQVPAQAGPTGPELPERSAVSLPLPLLQLPAIPQPVARGGSGGTCASAVAATTASSAFASSAAGTATTTSTTASDARIKASASATASPTGTATATMPPCPGTAGTVTVAAAAVAAAAAASTPFGAVRSAPTTPITSSNVTSPNGRSPPPPPPSASATLATATLPAAAAVAPGALAAASVAAATAAAAATAGAANSTLLAVCPAAPAAMRRPVWRLADYSVSGRLYKGEASSVYKAVCCLSGCKVVLKVYSLSRVADNALHTLVREVRIHTDLAHDHVLMMYGVFEEEERLVLVLERAMRGDLFHLHRSLPNFRMSEDQLRVLVLAPLLEALVYLHGRGVCHRDIKPENLLMTGSWQLRVADFGAAIDLTQERAVTRTGTMDYMAPEVERCPLKLLPEDNKDNPELAYSTSADVWSVGVLAYEMLAGFPPFINYSAAGEAAAGGSGGAAEGGGGGGGGRRELCFPHFVSAGGQDFIACALAERPMDRPTATELLRHPWLKHALRQHHARQQQQQVQQQQQRVQQREQQQQQQQVQQVQQREQQQQYVMEDLPQRLQQQQQILKQMLSSPPVPVPPPRSPPPQSPPPLPSMSNGLPPLQHLAPSPVGSLGRSNSSFRGPAGLKPSASLLR